MYIKAVNCLAVSFAVFYRQRDLPWILVPWSWRSRIRALWYNCESNQQYALYRLIYNSKSAVHVSGNVFAYHQEHLTVFTVSGSIHPICCRLVSWISWNSVLTHPWHQPAATWVNATRYCKYSHVLLMMGEKNRPKLVELNRSNKLTYIFASYWLLSQFYGEGRTISRIVFIQGYSKWLSGF